MLIKVCGMRIPAQIIALDEMKEIDWIGFIFYKQSKRFLNLHAVCTNGTKRVGVFVNESLVEIRNVISKNQLDLVQLHGNESPDFCRQLKGKVGVIKAFGVDVEFDFEKTKAYADSVDYFLFDTKSTNYGGTGIQFDWSILNKYTGNTPFFLSGGIRPDSLTEIKNMKHSKLIGVDLNSGFEIEPANKSLKEIESFVKELKAI
jgi:phosphoribosylanthranilate isomerase